MRKEVENWWMQAKKDLEAAEKNLKIGEYYLVAFLCQQAVEKALKALYIQKKRQSPGQTHSLTKLARDCGVQKKYTTFLRHLTSEYFLSRYPDATEDVPYMMYEEEDVKNYINQSKEVLDWVASRIEK